MALAGRKQRRGKGTHNKLEGDYFVLFYSNCDKSLFLITFASVNFIQ